MKPRVRVYSYDRVSWYEWRPFGVWRIEPGDVPNTWEQLQLYHQVPFVGY